jgi:hypothetical protein
MHTHVWDLDCPRLHERILYRNRNVATWLDARVPRALEHTAGFKGEHYLEDIAKRFPHVRSRQMAEIDCTTCSGTGKVNVSLVASISPDVRRVC